MMRSETNSHRALVKSYKRNVNHKSWVNSAPVLGGNVCSDCQTIAAHHLLVIAITHDAGDPAAQAGGEEQQANRPSPNCASCPFLAEVRCTFMAEWATCSLVSFNLYHICQRIGLWGGNLVVSWWRRLAHENWGILAIHRRISHWHLWGRKRGLVTRLIVGVSRGMDIRINLWVLGVLRSWDLRIGLLVWVSVRVVIKRGLICGLAVGIRL